MSFTSEWQERSLQIEEQARLVEMCADPATRAAALDLVRSVMELHKAALQRVLAVAGEQDEGKRMIEVFIRDPLIHSVLVLHDLHPNDVKTRVLAALEALKPMLERYHAEARVAGISEDAVRVLLNAPPQCGSTMDTLKSTIEQALLDAAPDAEIVVEAAATANAGFVPLEVLRPAAAEANEDAPAMGVAQPRA